MSSSDPLNKAYKLPIRQNDPVIILGMESTQLVGSVIMFVGPALIFRMNLLGMILAIAFWKFYSMTKINAGLKGGATHHLWRAGLWGSGDKYKYDATKPDLYS